jgi:thymidylate kinase
MACTSNKWVPALFSAWETAGIKYAVLRNHEKLPADTGNDLDLLVSRKQMREAEQILIRVMNEQGAVLHNRAEFSPVSLFFHDPETLEQFHVDLFRDLRWRGFELLAAERVLERARRCNDMQVLGKADEAVINLMTRLVFGGYVRDKYKQPVQEVFHEQAETVLPILSDVAGPLAKSIMNRVEEGDWPGIEALTRQVRRNVILRSMRRPLRTLAALFYDGWRLLVRWLKTPGLAIVMAGPDGCGKTSVGVELKERLGGTFYREHMTYVHWKPRLLKSMADAANPFGTPRTDPHAQPVRKPLMNILYFVAHSLEIPPAWLLRIRPRLFRNKLVIIDRYYYDFMVDPRRFRIRVSDKWAWLMYRLMPKPGLMICLTAPVDVIQSRKQEVTPEETERQCRAYAQVVDHLPYGYLIDTNRPLDQVVDEVQKTVLDYLADRCRERC